MEKNNTGNILNFHRLNISALLAFSAISSVLGGVANAQDVVSKEVVIARPSDGANSQIQVQSNERRNALEVNIPSLPAETQKVESVDKTLPVQLVDVQLADVFPTTQSQEVQQTKEFLDSDKKAIVVPKRTMISQSTVRPKSKNIAKKAEPKNLAVQENKLKKQTKKIAAHKETQAEASQTQEKSQVKKASYVEDATISNSELLLDNGQNNKFLIAAPLSVNSFISALSAVPSDNGVYKSAAPVAVEKSTVTKPVELENKVPVLQSAPSAFQLPAPVVISNTQPQASLNPEAFANLSPSAGVAAEEKVAAQSAQPAAPIVAQTAQEPLPEPIVTNSNPNADLPAPAVATTAPVTSPAPVGTSPANPVPVAVAPVQAPQQVVDNAFKPEPAANPVAEASQEKLSKESKKILAKMPKQIDSKEVEKPQKIAIEHGKNSKVNGEVEVESHEEVGIKIEVKKPGLDVNYELENAFNAMAAGQPTIAIELYKKALESQPGNIDAKLGLAIAYHRIGDLTTARALYADVLLKDPDNRDALNNFLGLVAEEAPDDALGKLMVLMKRNPDFSPIPAQMAMIYQKKGDFSNALTSMLRAVTLSPESLPYKYNLAVIFDKLGKREEAASLYSQLLDSIMRGENLNLNTKAIQERLTFLRSNRG